MSGFTCGSGQTPATSDVPPNPHVERYSRRVTKRRLRASLYARLSKQSDDSNLSLDGMVEDMRALCTREGLDPVAIHLDDGRSGGFRDRDEYGKWLNDARTGFAEVLVPYHTDRLTREGLNVAAQILDVVEGKDPATGRQSHRAVRLVDCFGLDSNHGDAFRFRFVIQAEVGRSERERIRQRNRDRDRRLRRAGRWAGGSIPFGYDAVPNPDGPGKVLVVNQAEALAVREAANALLRVDDPDNPSRVSRRMNHQGIKPRRAKQWSRKTLGQVLTSDAIVGRVIEHGQPLKNEEGEYLTPFPPVLTPGQLAALRKVLAVKEPSAKKGGRHPARLLSGLLTCHSCMTGLRVDRRSAGTNGPSIVYRCPRRGVGGVCDAPVTVSALTVEEHIEGRYLAAVGDMPFYREVTTVTVVDELAAVEEDVKAALADLANNADAKTFAKLQSLQAKQRELEAMEPVRRTELVSTGVTMREHWAGLMVDDRRDLLDSAFDELIIKPGVRGRRGFDPARLVAIWTEEPDAGEDYDE